MSLSITELRKGTKIAIHDEPWVVTDYAHHKMGRGGAVVNVKLRNLVSGAVLQKTFQGNERPEEAHVENAKAQYLYKDSDVAYFMDSETYDQFTIPIANIASEIDFMKDGAEVTIMKFREQPVAVQLPPKVVITVADTPPGVKGDTASGGNKPATLETGVTVQVPLFIKAGDNIRVNTETGMYVERA